MGRFLGRDPKEELAGLNLYAFVHNNPINKWDYLGMEECGQQDDDGYGSENSWESDLEADIGDLNDAAAEGRRELDDLWDRVEEEEKAAQQSASSLPDPNSIAGFNATITSTSVYINQTPSDYDLASPSVVEAIIELSSDGRLASSGSARGMNVPRPTLLEIENRLMENLAKERDPLMRWQRWRDIIQFRENNGLRTPTSPRDAEFRPDLPRVWTNPKHNQFSPSPQPRNALDLYKLSIPDGAGNRWAIDNNGVIHRFASDCNNIFHWNGSTGGSRPIQERTIPNEILLQLRPR